MKISPFWRFKSGLFVSLLPWKFSTNALPFNHLTCCPSSSWSTCGWKTWLRCTAFIGTKCHQKTHNILQLKSRQYMKCVILWSETVEVVMWQYSTVYVFETVAQFRKCMETASTVVEIRRQCLEFLHVNITHITGPFVIPEDEDNW